MAASHRYCKFRLTPMGPLNRGSWFSKWHIKSMGELKWIFHHSLPNRINFGLVSAADFVKIVEVLNFKQLLY